MTSQIRVLSKFDRSLNDPTQTTDPERLPASGSSDTVSRFHSRGSICRLKHESEARSFKLIDSSEWNIASSEPSSEATFFADGHSAMSIVSVIGAKGIGKSTLMNKIAGREVFETYQTSKQSNNPIKLRHVTRGIDIHSTHHRILLDCQPLLAVSVLEDFVSGQSSSQFSKSNPASDPTTSSHIISLQLVTFLIATSDYVIIMSKWLIDVHLLKLISSAIMMIGEDNLRAKFIIYSADKTVHDKNLKHLIEDCLGMGRIEGYVDNIDKLLDLITPYSSEKCDRYHKDPTTFSGKNWLSSCQRLWNTTIRNSSMFSDYALQILSTSNLNM